MLTAEQVQQTGRTGVDRTVVRVTEKVRVADGVVTLTLTAPDGGRLPDWTPGAHVDLTLDNGLTRQYSLCGDPHDRTVWQIGILREPEGRGGSAYVHDEVLEGMEIDVRGPRNNFELVPAPKYVFIAGGIGITPILPMAAAAEEAGAEWEFHYGGRTNTVSSASILSRSSSTPRSANPE